MLIENIKIQSFRFSPFTNSEELCAEESQRLKLIVYTIGLRDIDRVLNELSSSRDSFSIEFVQHLLSAYLEMSLIYPSYQHLIVNIIQELPKRLKFPSLQYKEIVIVQLIRTWVFNLNEALDATIFANVAKELFDKSFFDGQDVIKILFFLSKYLKVVEQAAKALSNFVKAFETFFHPQKLSPNRKKEIVKIGRFLSDVIKDENVSETTKNFLKNALEIMNLKIVESEAEEEISESFKLLVKKIQNREPTDGEILLRNHEKEVKFFVEAAMTDVESAIKFAKVLPSLFHNDPCGAYLFYDLVSLTMERKFFEQHSEGLRSKFSKTEVRTTNRFIAELFYNTYLHASNFRGLNYQIDNKSSMCALTKDCVALLLIVLMSKPGFRSNKT